LFDVGILTASAAFAGDPTSVKASLKDHRFVPAKPMAPASKPTAIEVTNLGSTPLVIHVLIFLPAMRLIYIRD
jgi:hypothetical protein